jgi:hypothetical protein
MAKRKKKAKPRRRRAVATPPPQFGADTEDIETRYQKRLARLYDGVSTKEEILERVQTELIRPLYDWLIGEDAKRLVLWWRNYKQKIITDDHETTETVIIKIRTGALLDCVAERFSRASERNAVRDKSEDLLYALTIARRPIPLPSEPPPC